MFTQIARIEVVLRLPTEYDRHHSVTFVAKYLELVDVVFVLTIHIVLGVFLQLGTVNADKHVDFSLTVCPVRLGLVTIGRLQLTDVFVKQTYNFNDFVQVFVVDEQYRDDDLFEMDKYVQYGMEKPIAAAVS